MLGVILCECQAEEALAVEMNPCSAPEIWSNSSSVSNCPVTVDTLLLAFSCHDLLAIVVLKDCNFFSRGPADEQLQSRSQVHSIHHVDVRQVGRRSVEFLKKSPEKE